MNKVNIIASIVEGETLCDFGLLMEDTDFKNLLKAVINLPLEEATSQLINKKQELKQIKKIYIKSINWQKNN